MNAPTEADVALATTRGGGQRGRGRGGARGRISGARTSTPAPKAQKAKIGPNRSMETEWVKDSILKGNCFVLFAGSGLTSDQQWTFHHPIGETVLEESEWVATPTRDIGFLLNRRESEALAAWKRRAELAKRQQVLWSKKGRGLGPDKETEVWLFENAPAIQPTIRSCMTAAKAAGAPESTWLAYADQAVRAAEQSFKESLRTQCIPAGWVRINPRPQHETMGGPLGTQPQKAVPYLKGLSLAAAKDKVIRVAIGIDHTEDSSSDDSDDDDNDPKAPKGPMDPAPAIQLDIRGVTTPDVKSDGGDPVDNSTVDPGRRPSGA